MQLQQMDVSVFRWPVQRPVLTSFGTMKDRPAVFVRITDTDGAFGWGEIFANWPAAGAEHRARLLIEDIADILAGRTFASPGEAFALLEKATHIRALQCGEWGPFRHVIGGLDTAFHDLFARKLGLPVRRMLNPTAPDQVPAYASGIGITQAETMIPEARALGFKRFKVKVGFNREADIAQLRRVYAGLAAGEVLCVDANQAWNVEEALHFSRAVVDLPLGWIEEPIPADAPASEWLRLAESIQHPLAAGENMAGVAEFEAAIASGVFSFLQPDLAKWGGFSGCGVVAARILAAGQTYCPHFLGGGVGLAASAHLLAAAGGNGVLEVDVNPNPLRDVCGTIASHLRDGAWVMNQEPGLGYDDPTVGIEAFRTLQRTVGY